MTNRISNTIQRDPVKVQAIADELVRLIAAEDCGEAPTHVEGGSFEAEVFWLSRNMKLSRENLLRAAALIVEDIVLLDLERKTTSL